MRTRWIGNRQIPRRTCPACLFLIALTLGFSTVTPSGPVQAQSDLETAVQAFNSGRHEWAIGAMLALAEGGDTQAKYTLGIIYTQGQGVPADYEQAARWLGEAANEGSPNAQYSFGMLHAGGIGVPQDLVRGLMWLNIALADLAADRAFRLQIVSMAAILKKSMSPEQVAEAGKLSSLWRAREK